MTLAERRVTLRERSLECDAMEIANQKKRLLLPAPEPVPPVPAVGLKTLSGLLLEHGYKGQAKKQCVDKYAYEVAVAYSKKHGEAPVKHQTFGTNQYSDADWPLINAVISKGQTGLGQWFK